jgi:hypothetical protein
VGLLLCVQQQHHSSKRSKGSTKQSNLTSDVLEDLEQAKNKAAGAEDYARANELKDAITRIKTARGRLDEATACGAWGQLAEVRI